MKRIYRHIRKIKKSRLTIETFLVIVVVLAIFSYLTNPFVRFSIVKDPILVTQKTNGQFSVTQKNTLRSYDNLFTRTIAWIQTGYHIASNRFNRNRITKNDSLGDIIKEIHALRFDPQEPFLISGDHFVMLYPRSLGIFYNTLLDPRTALDAKDWENRQILYLKTTAYALDAFANAGKMTTTITAIGPSAVTLINIYAPPSDTLYSLLYALVVMQQTEMLYATYPFTTAATLPLQTQDAAKALLDLYRDFLVQQVHDFQTQVTDPQTGLIRQDVQLSGTKDIAVRESAFYDNVMLWKTLSLAQNLGLIAKNQPELDELKQRIIDTFWLSAEGYFVEDLSDEAISNKYYSSEWLIAVMTGFLDPANPPERALLQRSVAFIQKENIDQPFGLRFHNEPRNHQLHFIPRLFTNAYGANAIWSNWGMEYIKLLARLYQETCEQRYLDTAKTQLDAYSANIASYRGYPEVYRPDGTLYQSAFYKSVIRTGWVVNYEETRAMLDWTTQNSCQ